MKQLLTVILFIIAGCKTCYSQNTAPADSSIKKQVNAQSKDGGNGKAVSTLEEEPQINEGAWSKFLQKHINYDIAVFNDAPRGSYKVKVQFTVFTDGHVGDVKALTRYGYGMEEEVVRALKKSPNWTPATQNGKTVNATKIQTVTFKVEVL